MSYYTATAEKFEEAKKIENYYVTMSGDYGGDHYLCCPTKNIKCDFKTLQNLLLEIDIWDKEGVELNFIEIKPSNSWLTTGEGGGDCLWLGRRLEKKRKRIQGILNGKRKNIGTNLTDVLKFIVKLPIFIIMFLRILNALNKRDKEEKK
ncbi:MAG: hypothetical protein WCV71_02060 [Patescibacteria group bacterium]|jgi:hypothetical protein